MLNVSKTQVYRLVDTDDLYGIRIGRSIRISEMSVGRFVDQGGTEWEQTA